MAIFDNGSFRLSSTKITMPRINDPYDEVLEKYDANTQKVGGFFSIFDPGLFAGDDPGEGRETIGLDWNGCHRHLPS